MGSRMMIGRGVRFGFRRVWFDCVGPMFFQRQLWYVVSVHQVLYSSNICPVSHCQALLHAINSPRGHRETTVLAKPNAP